MPRPPSPEEPGYNSEALPTLPMEVWSDFETALRSRQPGDFIQPCEWALVIYAGSNLGRVFALSAGENGIGRSPMARIPLLDEEISRHHARVLLSQEAEGTRLVLEDTGSTNGTLLNGRAVTSPTLLKAGDRIALGGHVLKLVAMDPLERAFHQTLLEQSTKDALTGLGNRGAVLGELQNRFELSRRHVRPMSVVMVDLDHFKQLNDTHGHGSGDLVLRIFADLVRLNLRSTDLAGRIGGEEFLLVLPETDTQGAMLLAERLRLAVQNTTIQLPDLCLQVTASMGVAERSSKDRDGGDLLGRADAALYRAKHLGRNRTEIA